MTNDQTAASEEPDILRIDTRLFLIQRTSDQVPMVPEAMHGAFVRKGGTWLVTDREGSVFAALVRDGESRWFVNAVRRGIAVFFNFATDSLTDIALGIHNLSPGAQAEFCKALARSLDEGGTIMFDRTRAGGMTHWRPNAIMGETVNRGKMWKDDTWQSAVQKHANEARRAGDSRFLVTEEGIWMEGDGSRKTFRTKLPRGVEGFARVAIARAGLSESTRTKGLMVCPRYK